MLVDFGDPKTIFDNPKKGRDLPSLRTAGLGYTRLDAFMSYSRFGTCGIAQCDQK